MAVMKVRNGSEWIPVAGESLNMANFSLEQNPSSGKLQLKYGGNFVGTGATVALNNLIGTTSVGSTTQPIYWNGSSFAPISTGAFLTTTSADSLYMKRNGDAVIGNYTINGNLTATKVFGAVWNDYAEYRASDCGTAYAPGRCVVEVGDDTITLSNARMLPGAMIVSDTFGFSIGQTEIANTPIAVSGRVLAYINDDIKNVHVGDPVCSGPNGCVSIMRREEVVAFPERMIGTVSAIPTYKTWGENNIPVNGRIWIKVK